MIWGDATAGDCVHGEPGVSCRACHPQREDWDSPWTLVAAFALVIGFVLFGPAAVRRELDNDDARQQRHRDRVAAALDAEGR